MNTGRYAKISKADSTISDSGFLRAWVSLVSDFVADTGLKEPILSSTPAIGEQYTIGTSHVWQTGKGAIPCYIDKKILEASGETTGSNGSLRLKWKPVIFFKGDGPKILEMTNNLMNEELIVFFENSCENPIKVQFGCDCSPVEGTKVTFTSGTIDGTDTVGYKMEMECNCKNFYNGAITERTA